MPSAAPRPDKPLFLTLKSDLSAGARQRCGQPRGARRGARPGHRRRQAAARVPARRQGRALWRADDADERVAQRRLSARGAGRPRSGEAAAMNATRETFAVRRWPETLRWGACFALALGFHAAGAAALLARWNEDSDLVANAPVIMIELAAAAGRARYHADRSAARPAANASRSRSPSRQSRSRRRSSCRPRRRPKLLRSCRRRSRSKSRSKRSPSKNRPA